MRKRDLQTLLDVQHRIIHEAAFLVVLLQESTRQGVSPRAAEALQGEIQGTIGALEPLLSAGGYFEPWLDGHGRRLTLWADAYQVEVPHP
jgi:hypothetical protein